MPQRPERVRAVASVRGAFGQGERVIDGLVVVRERERIVPIKMRKRGEEEQQLPDREVGCVDLAENLGETQRVRGLRVPAVSGRLRVESGKNRERIEVRGNDLDEFRSALRARIPRPGVPFDAAQLGVRLCSSSSLLDNTRNEKARHSDRAFVNVRSAFQELRDLLERGVITRAKPTKVSVIEDHKLA